MEEKKKSILSRRGYTIRKDRYSPRQIQKLRKDLTVKPKTFAQFSQNVLPFQIYLESQKKLYIPKYYGLNILGEPESNNITNGDEISIKFKGDLRPEQKPVAEKFLEVAEKEGGGLISLPCGYGKTILGIYLACQLKQKTLVVVHKDFLLNQWKERIEQFVPEAEIGVIKQNKVNITGKDIVLAMLQSISMKEYPEDTFDSFGFVIVDECHHLAAEVFSRALPKISTRYMLGLSATPNRKDGLSKVFEWYLGNMVYCIKQREPDLVLVELIQYYSNDNRYSKDEIMYNGNRCTSRMITNICQFAPRTKVIVDKLKTLIEDNRRILILSDRRDHLTTMKDNIDKLKLCTTGYYVGGSKQWELKESEDKDVILGTYSMACISDTSEMINYFTGDKIPIKELQHKQINVIGFNETNNRFELGENTRFQYTKNKKSYKIIYQLGEIITSYDHQLYTQRGWIYCQDLMKTDKLVYPRKMHYQGVYNSKYTNNILQDIGDNLLYYKKIPFEIMQLDNQQIRVILERFLIIDNIGDNYPIQSFTTTNILYQLHFLFKRIDIITHIENNTLTLINNIDTITNNKVILNYNLELIPFYNDYLDDMGYTNILDIIEIDKTLIKLCDIEIPKYHSFIVENILVHNSEGMDIPKLNTIILASPKTDVEQSVGRILRQKKKDREKNPLIIDIIDNFSTFIRQSKKRISFYKKQKYIIENINIEDINNLDNQNNEPDIMEQFNKGICQIDD